MANLHPVGQSTPEQDGHKQPVLLLEFGTLIHVDFAQFNNDAIGLRRRDEGGSEVIA